MLVTAIEGIVESGRIRLQDDVLLPENTKVYVIIAGAQEKPAAHIFNPRLAHPEQSKDFRKQIVEVPTDAKL